MSDFPETVHRRALDRHRAAALRAVSGDPTAELRANRLVSEGRPVGVASPYLALDRDARSDVDVSRGVADGLALLLKHSDLDLHRELAPKRAFERVIFDVLEQIRCEAVGPHLVGVKQNLTSAFGAWCSGARADRVGERAVALLVYTVIHMARSRLLAVVIDEEVDALTEVTRANVGPIIGRELRKLPALVGDQRAYAQASLEIARLVGEVAGDAANDRPEQDDTAEDRKHRMLLPVDLDDPDNQLEGVPVPGLDGLGVEHDAGQPLSALGDYRVFTSEFDREVHAESLYPAAKRRELRRSLDERTAAQAVSPQRLALRLRHLFGSWEEKDWAFGQEDGLIDGRRLAQLVSGSSSTEIFRQPRPVIQSNTAVAFLMDNSGSMKRQKFEALAVLVDTYSHALDLAGVTNEVLGFSTASWAGGKAQAAWHAAGRPDGPGRLSEIQHVIYKDADTPWRRARSSLATMMYPMHFREGVDGEAIAWAHGRLLRRPEQRKVLVVVSDGAPMDASTANANRDGFLTDHLARVVHQIEHHTPVQIGALSLDLDVAGIFTHSLPITLDGVLTLDSYRALEHLFA